MVTIAGVGHSGEGVGRYQDLTVFVPQALPGEIVETKITEVKKNYAKGKLVAVKQVSPDRMKPPCPVYEMCGGCQLQHLSYEGQLAIKHRQVHDAVIRIGKLSDVTIHPTLGAVHPWHYRNKMQFPVGTDAGGSIVIGCYAQGSHTIVPTDNCLIQHMSNNTIASQVQRIATEVGLLPYNELTGEGLLRHVMGRVGTATGEVMIVLVTAGDTIPRAPELITALREAVPGVVSIMQNINPRRTNVILGEVTRTFWGKDTITDRLGSLTFHISARSFFQVNTEQTLQLYGRAVDYAGLTGRETVIDAYCGTGTISLFLARQAAKVYGIEIVPSAIEDAWANARTNGITNAEFMTGDAVDIMPRLYRQGVRPDVIVVDPPRAGCDQIVLETFATMNPRRIVYVSCNPASLARDLAILDKLGYKTREIQPVDMFPMTFHIETVTLLQRKDTTI